MATSQLPSAVDPAVRMALTRAGGQKKYLHGYSVQNSYHMSENSISDWAAFVNSFPFSGVPSSALLCIHLSPQSYTLGDKYAIFRHFLRKFYSFLFPLFFLFPRKKLPFSKKFLQNRFPGLFLPPVSLYNLLNTLRFC